ncbi:transporter substrate-binding domain-containing protein [Pelotomaculum schinkii]|uniref:transporter substrate-binding domain-containing protein n=1 Tax=Pelotomaculum schinkii TaxID=78350 RepID=UPI00167DF86A|nr:transporter substrate-binding domain-containing protein [Pelotomaculum schinkii]
MIKKVFPLLLGVLIGALVFGTIGFASGSQRQITVDFLPLKFFFNGVEKHLEQDQPAFVYNDVTYVPVRFVAETLGRPVEWDGDNLSIFIGEKSSGKQKIIVGSDATYPPFEYQDEAGRYVGFDLDMMAAIAEAADLEVDFRDMPFDQLISALRSEQIDAVVSALSIIEARKAVMDFTDPYFHSGLIIAVRPDNSSINSLQDLKGKSIGVLSVTSAEEHAKKVPDAKVKSFGSWEQAFLGLEEGTVEAVISDYPVAANFIKQGYDLRLAGEKFAVADYGIAVSKNNPELLQKLNSGLQTIKANGQYDIIYKKWFKD